MANTNPRPARGPVPRGRVGRVSTDIVAVERQAAAARLRAEGKTFQEVADALGYSGPNSAKNAVDAAIARVAAEPAEDARAFEAARMEALWQRAVEVMLRQHVVAQQGRIVRDDDGRPLLDDGPVLAAITTLLKIGERKARLLGLDLPVRNGALDENAVRARVGAAVSAMASMLQRVAASVPAEVRPALEASVNAELGSLIASLMGSPAPAAIDGEVVGDALEDDD